jgi:methylmalonyl-CoA mutase cobalamin-binding subunit
MVVHAATNLGWKVIYLGASLPAADLAGAAMQNHARAVALSIIYPDDDPQLPEELLRLRKYLSPEIKILVGGRAANNYLAPLRRIGAELIEDLPSLFQTLGTIRTNRG